MPGSCTAGARATRIVGFVAFALLFAACSGGGGGGGGGGSLAAGGSQPTGTTGSSSVTMSWGSASGPVAGYAVYVDRGNGQFARELDVRRAAVKLTGEPGTRARVVVAAFDANGNTGPSSVPSPTFTFPNLPSEAAAQSAALQQAPDAVTRTVAGASAISQGAPDALDRDDASAQSDEDVASERAAQSTAGSLVWQSGNDLRLTDADLVTTQQFTRPSPDALVAGVGDFDGDGFGDLLWVDSTGRLSYTPDALLAQDGAQATAIAFGELEGGARIGGAGDFDGDGVDDLLVLRSDHAADVWYTMPGDLVEMASVGNTGGATLVGVGDFDGDGHDDIAWSDTQGGVVLWLMDAAGASASVEVALGAGLSVTGIGDFDGNGSAELAVRDAAGDVFLVHPMQDPGALVATDLASAADWRAAGSVDLDRDGTDDLVLVGQGALRTAYLPGDAVQPLEPGSTWSLVALLP